MVNIDIVSGFLGAGKTTFIQTLLKYCLDRGEKTVYVVNEFGEAGIDGMLMQNEGCDVFELANGCICCTLRTDFANVLKDVLENVKPDRIVFEPSGVFVFADFFSFLQSGWIADKCRVDHVVTIVDAVTFPKLYQTASYMIENQIRGAGVVILSKTQLENAKVAETICDVRNISPDVNIISVDWAEFTPEFLEEAMAAAPIRRKERLSVGSRPASIKSAVVNNAQRHMVFETARLETEPFGTYDELVAFARGAADGKMGNVVRGKGFLRCGVGETYLVNIVGGECDITPYKYTAENSFTIIGTDLLS